MPFPLNPFGELRPPQPTFTDVNVPDLRGKVYLVTGSNSGLGKELARILYSKNAKVYMAARSEEKAQEAIDDIKKAVSGSGGELIFLQLDLADLVAVKAAASEFLAKESRLHVLFNNAGVMAPPEGSKTAQGHELQLGVNCVGSFMLTQLLTPLLATTAKTEPPSSIRVVWLSSIAAENFSHKPGGVRIDNLDYHEDRSTSIKYGISKAGNFLLGSEHARRHGDADGIVSIVLNPGNLDTGLMRHRSSIEKILIKKLIHYPAIFGVYTMLYAAISPDVTVERVKAEDWVVPWGRFAPIRKDLSAATKPTSEGGTGIAQEFWRWNEEQIKPYL